MLELATGTNQQLIGVMPGQGMKKRFSKEYRIGQVLSILAYHDKGITCGDIAKSIGITPQYTRMLVLEMRARGLVDGYHVDHRPGWIKFIIYPVVQS